MFEPFYRLEGSRNQETGGSGLGLAIARQPAANSWTLSIRRREDGGTEAQLICKTINAERLRRAGMTRALLNDGKPAGGRRWRPSCSSEANSGVITGQSTRGSRLGGSELQCLQFAVKLRAVHCFGGIGGTGLGAAPAS